MEICKQKLLLVKEQSFEYNAQINNKLDVINFITDIIKIHNEAQEVVYLLTVNSKNQIVGFIEIARGGINWCNLSISELFKSILMSNSIKFILIHNHPSGDATPSNTDIELTKEILEGAKILRLNFLDHIVIGNNNYQSIMEILKI